VYFPPSANGNGNTFLPVSRWEVRGLVTSLQQRVSGKRDDKEQDVQLERRGSELRVSRCTYTAEQLADELS